MEFWQFRKFASEKNKEKSISKTIKKKKELILFVEKLDFSITFFFLLTKRCFSQKISKFCKKTGKKNGKCFESLSKPVKYLFCAKLLSKNLKNYVKRTCSAQRLSENDRTTGYHKTSGSDKRTFHGAYTTYLLFSHTSPRATISI